MTGTYNDVCGRAESHEGAVHGRHDPQGAIGEDGDLVPQPAVLYGDGALALAQRKERVGGTAVPRFVAGVARPLRGKDFVRTKIARRVNTTVL
jgi:hypothetical protein